MSSKKPPTVLLSFSRVLEFSGTITGVTYLLVRLGPG
jgi:hypothetical protein